MPTLMQDGKDLVYFAAWKHTISLYPLPAVAGNFAAMVAPYRAAKSRVRFPLGKSLPYDLISRLGRRHSDRSVIALAYVMLRDACW